MTARRLRRAALATTAALALAVPAGADAVVDLDDLEATARDGVVTVEGDVDLSGAPIVVEDADGDGLTPGSDIDRVEVELIDDRNAAFRVVLADPLPEVGNTTGTMVFWEMRAGGQAVQLSAMHNRYSSPGGWSFQIETCTPDPNTGTNTCTGAPLFGTYADGVIEMDVSLGSLGIGLGDKITQDGAGVYTTVGAAGLLWNGTDMQDGVAFGAIQLPTLTVTATNAANGTTASDTPSKGDVDLELPGAVGDAITVEACLDAVCDTGDVIVR